MGTLRAQTFLILASLKREKSLYLVWIMSLAMAVMGLVTVDLFRESLSQTLKTHGRKILTGDLSLSVRRRLSEKEVQQFKSELPKASSTSQLFELFAMVTSGESSRLALVRFIDDTYPLAGELNVRIDGAGPQSLKGNSLKSETAVWVARDMLQMMNLQIGDTLQVGQLKARILGTVEKDSSQTFRMGNMAPRVYLHVDDLAKTELIQFGSTFTETQIAIVSSNSDNQGLGKSLKKILEKKFSDPAVEVTTPEDLEQGSLRVLSRVSDFLGLIGLVTLTLGWVGVYYLGRRWLSLERFNIGLFKSLGFSRRELAFFLNFKLTLILSFGVIFGGLISWLAFSSLVPLIKDSLPAEFYPVWSWKSTLLLIAIGPLSGWLLLAPAIQSIVNEKSLALFSEVTTTPGRLKSSWLTLLPMAALFFALTLLQAKSWSVAGVFLGGLFAITVLIYGFSFLTLKLVARSRKHTQNWLYFISSAVWVRRQSLTIIMVIVSALSGLLAQLIPQIERTLTVELKTPENLKRPGLFLFDIQDEQLDSLKELLSKKQISVSQSSPFIRARLIKINDQPFERSELGQFQTREQEVEARFRNRGVNLSFRAQLADSETIIEGKAWDQHSKDTVEISVEKGYAERLGLNLKDRLLFDIQGVEIAATIASIRTVNWNSFQPNFFIQFPEGVLNDAPKTWIMTVDQHAELSVIQIQALVSKEFPNITSINVDEAIQSATDLIAKLSRGVSLASQLALFLGLGVFMMILIFQLHSSQKDSVQLMIVGLSRPQIGLFQLVTFGSLSLFGSLLGSLFSIGFSFAIAKTVFGTLPTFSFLEIFKILLITWVVVILGLGWMGLKQLKLTKAALS